MAQFSGLKRMEGEEKEKKLTICKSIEENLGLIGWK